MKILTRYKCFFPEVHRDWPRVYIEQVFEDSRCVCVKVYVFSGPSEDELLGSVTVTRDDDVSAEGESEVLISRTNQMLLFLPHQYQEFSVDMRQLVGGAFGVTEDIGVAILSDVDEEFAYVRVKIIRGKEESEKDKVTMNLMGRVCVVCDPPEILSEN